MTLNPAIRKMRYVNNNQCLLTANQPPATKAPATFPCAATHSYPVLVYFHFWQEKPEDENQDRRKAANPEKRSPAMGRLLFTRPRAKTVARRYPKAQPCCNIPLTIPSRRGRTILQGRCSGLPIQPSHNNTEQRPASQKLAICVAEPCAELEDSEEDVVDDERPLCTHIDPQQYLQVKFR